jgi:hypothetical protein
MKLAGENLEANGDKPQTKLGLGITLLLTGEFFLCR